MLCHSPFARPEDAGSDVQRRDVELRFVAAELHQLTGEIVVVDLGLELPESDVRLDVARVVEGGSSQRA